MSTIEVSLGEALIKTHLLVGDISGMTPFIVHRIVFIVDDLIQGCFRGCIQGQNSKQHKYKILSTYNGKA